MRAGPILAGLILLTPAAAAAAPHRTAAGPEARLRRLEDIEQIRTLLVDYGRSLDRRDWAAYAALFAREGEWVGGFGTAKGPAAIEAMMRKGVGGAANDDPQRNFHLLTNFEIEADGDHGRAWSRWSFVAEGPDGRAQVLYAGRYDDVLVREDGRWKFERRTVTGDLPGAPRPPG